MRRGDDGGPGAGPLVAPTVFALVVDGKTVAVVLDRGHPPPPPDQRGDHPFYKRSLARIGLADNRKNGDRLIHVLLIYNIVILFKVIRPLLHPGTLSCRINLFFAQVVDIARATKTIKPLFPAGFGQNKFTVRFPIRSFPRRDINAME